MMLRSHIRNTQRCIELSSSPPAHEPDAALLHIAKKETGPRGRHEDAVKRGVGDAFLISFLILALVQIQPNSASRIKTDAGTPRAHRRI